MALLLIRPLLFLMESLTNEKMTWSKLLLPLLYLERQVMGKLHLETLALCMWLRKVRRLHRIL